MLIKKDPGLIAPYLEDYSNIQGGSCSKVFFPESEEEISEILRSASRDKTPITITGGGTGVTGGRIPFGGSVLSVEKLNKIKEIRRLESGEGIAVVGAGVVLKDFLVAIEAEGFFYPPDPTEKGSFVGGNVATAASGARSFRFGTTRDYVQGLSLILSNGGKLDIGRRETFVGKGRVLELTQTSCGRIRVELPGYAIPQVKNAAGYYVKDNMDAVDLFIGQEGTLGVITEIKLRLLKKLSDLLDCYAFFKREEDALLFAQKARQMSLINRSSASGYINAITLEFFDRNSLQLLSERHKRIPRDAEAAIYFEQETDKDIESHVLDAWAELLTECNGLLEKTWFAQGEKERAHLQAIRHDLPDMVNELIKKRKQAKIGTDIAVRYNYLHNMIRLYHGLLSEAGLRYVIFGHIGDGHLHVNILPESRRQYEKARDIYKRFVKEAISSGGTVSAEHGIGKVKHAYLEMMYGRRALKEMARLKKTLDPACILGLGNIFPKELLV